MPDRNRAWPRHDPLAWRHRRQSAGGCAFRREGCRMIVPPTNVRVLIATKPVDFRRGVMGLAAIVEAEFKADPFSGVIYVFRSKRADRIKLLFWDGTGICMLIKRLEDARFCWPRIEDGVMRLSPAQLSALLEGLEWTRVHARRVTRPTATQ